MTGAGQGVKRGERVLLVGGHPWAGSTATVVDYDSLGLLVRLDTGMDRAYALPGDWRRLSEQEMT